MNTTSSPLPEQAQATVQALYAAFGRMDLPAFLGRLSPEVSWRFLGAPGLAYSRQATGREGVQAWLEDVLGLEDIQAFEPRTFHAGGDHVTVWGWERTTVKSTGQTFECEWVHVFEVRDGLVTRFQGLYDTARVAAAYARKP